MQDKPIILYVVASTHTLRALFALQDEHDKEDPIYYISWTLIDYET